MDTFCTLHGNTDMLAPTKAWALIDVCFVGVIMKQNFGAYTQDVL